MVKPIVKDMFFLGMPSEPATKADAQVIVDLQDTLRAHTRECVGMAANMIGVRKRIIIVSLGIAQLVMVNPVIVKKSQPFETEEGCLSLAGTRKTTRYKTIEVSYEDHNFVSQKRTFSGFHAQIIQHEIDHCNGIII